MLKTSIWALIATIWASLTRAVSTGALWLQNMVVWVSTHIVGVANKVDTFVEENVVIEALLIVIGVGLVMAKLVRARYNASLEDKAKRTDGDEEAAVWPWVLMSVIGIAIALWAITV